MPADSTSSQTGFSNDSNTPLIPEYHSAETACDYRNLLAEELGFEPVRYPSGLPKRILRRMHALIVTELEPQDKTLGEYRAEIVRELKLGEAAQYLTTTRPLDRYKLVQIADELQTYTKDDLQTVADAEEQRFDQ